MVTSSLRAFSRASLRSPRALLTLCGCLPLALACSSTPGGDTDGSLASGGSSGGSLGATGGAAPGSGGVSTGSGGSSTSTGGATATGGAAQTGGSESGGSASDGGSASGGSESGSGGSGTGGTGAIGGLPEVECEITLIEADLAAIETVGVITFSTDLPGATTAEIQFGPDEEYGLTAPVDLAEANYRTLLLGMKQDATYHYRIAVSDGTSVCLGEDQTIETGTLSTVAPDSTVHADGAADGFIVMSRGGDTLILDRDGDVVWGMDMGGPIFSAAMSWDGKHMFGRDSGPFDAGTGGTFRRVAMDGTGLTSMDAPGGDHHDFTAIPGGIAYIAKVAEDECDQIYTASDDLTDGTPLVDTWEIYEFFPASGMGANELCHANRLHYFADGDIFTISDRNKNALGVFSGDGTVVTSIGKTPTGDWTSHIQAQGANTDWNIQHGHHFYAEDKLLVFSNNASGGSAMLHYTITGNSAALDWKYADAGSSNTQGDVQYLPNGNFLVLASNAGELHQLGPDRSLLVQSSFGLGGGPGAGVGYAWFRPTLYGTPPAR